jgi:isopropylmalate/homocitrate/citramalate synthase
VGIGFIFNSIHPKTDILAAVQRFTSNIDKGLDRMKLDKALRREKKQNKSKNGMQVSNKSIFTIVETQVNRAKNQ